MAQPYTFLLKGIFVTMRWLLLFILFLPACFDKPDCISQADTALLIQFKKRMSGAPDTVVIYHVEAVGADSIFYFQRPVDQPDTLRGIPLVLAVNPFADSTFFIFRFTEDEKRLHLNYQRTARFIQDDCFSEVLISNLRPIFSDFDSIRIVQPTLTKNRTVHLEIFR